MHIESDTVLEQFFVLSMKTTGLFKVPPSSYFKLLLIVISYYRTKFPS